MRPNETELLVVDDDADEYYATRGIVIRGSQSNVMRLRSRAPKQQTPTPTPEEIITTHRPSTPVVTLVNGHDESRREEGASSSSSSEDLNEAPIPRLCHVVKWKESDGFGFHLLADKQRKVMRFMFPV